MPTMFIRKPGTYKCKKCFVPLGGEFIRLGYCETCIADEFTRLKKRIIRSALIGACLTAFLIAAYHYMQMNYFRSEMRGYEGDIFIPVFQGFLALNANSFNRIMNCSILMKVWIVVFCFSLPFSSFVKIEYKTYRHKAEQELYQVGTYVGNMSASSNHQRMDDAGLFIVSLLVSAVSGPFFLIYRLYKMLQIGRYIKR